MRNELKTSTTPRGHEGIAVERAVDEKLADARNAEKRLDDDRAGQDAGGGRPAVTDDRQDGDLERVAEKDGVLRQALGARGADEVELEHFEQAAAREPRDGRGERNRKADRGKNDLVGRTPAVATGRRLSSEREEHDQQRREDEARNRNAEQRDEHERAGRPPGCAGPPPSRRR